MQGTMPFVVLTAALAIGWATIMTLAFRSAVARDWDHRRCEPGVLMLAGWYKPDKDPRTASEFARDNFSFCQKQYVKDAVKVAAEAPAAAARAQAGVSRVVSEMSSAMADVFFNLWGFCYEAYSNFMETMNGASKLFRNFLIQLNSIIERLQGSVVSIAFALMSLIAAFIASVKVIIIVAIVIIGILLILQIILFFILMPISGLIITVTAIVSVAVVAIATAVGAVMVSEMFASGACFDVGTSVVLADGSTAAIETMKLGQRLADGGVVTAVHEFETHEAAWSHDGIRVTGDHLIENTEDGRLVPVSRCGDFQQDTAPSDSNRRVWCLTTTNRRIPVRGSSGAVLRFADWEEIDDDDTDNQKEWFHAVFGALNVPEINSPSDIIIQRAVHSDAGMSPDAKISVPSWFGFGRRQVRACDVRIGDTVLDANGWPTRVLGIVEMEGSLAADAVVLPCAEGTEGALVSMGTWIRDPATNVWSPPFFGEPRDLHPVRWLHFYTTSGSLTVGGWGIRDASDVGLGSIGKIVEQVVLPNSKFQNRR